MKILFGIIFGSLVLQTNINAAEAGMPQLDPEFWASQAFWLILVFTSLYLIIAKIFIPKIKNGLEDRENKGEEIKNVCRLPNSYVPWEFENLFYTSTFLLPMFL